MSGFVRGIGGRHTERAALGGEVREGDLVVNTDTTRSRRSSKGALDVAVDGSSPEGILWECSFYG